MWASPRERHSISNHRQFYCLFNSFIRLITTWKLHIIDSFWRESIDDWWIPSQRASNAELVCASWRHHGVGPWVLAGIYTLAEIIKESSKPKKKNVLLRLRAIHSLKYFPSLRWRHNDHAGVSNHQPHGCLLNRLFRRKSKKTSKLRVTGLCTGNSPGTGEFPAQMSSYAENVSIWWRHHGIEINIEINGVIYVYIWWF